jgi:hypothetical protein
MIPSTHPTYFHSENFVPKFYYTQSGHNDITALKEGKPGYNFRVNEGLTQYFTRAQDNTGEP